MMNTRQPLVPICLSVHIIMPAVSNGMAEIIIMAVILLDRGMAHPASVVFLLLPVQIQRLIMWIQTVMDMEPVPELHLVRIWGLVIQLKPVIVMIIIRLLTPAQRISVME